MASEKPVQIVWFKRDLRLQDHAPLFHATQCGDTSALLIYIFEPQMLSYKDTSLRHLLFQYHSLLELNEILEPHGRRIHVFWGEAKEVFGYLLRSFKVQ